MTDIILKEIRGPAEEITPETWLDMYNKLSASLNQIQDKLKGTVHLTPKETISDSLGNRLDAVEELLVAQQTRIKLLEGIAIKQDEELCNLRKEIVYLRREKVKANVLILGMEQEREQKESKAELQEKVKKFFKDMLKIETEIKIKNAYRRGRKNWVDRAVVVKLANIEDKALIFKNANNLKGQKNVRRRLFMVKDEEDAQQTENRYIYRELLKENDALPTDDKLTIKFKRGEVMVNNQVLEKTVHAPTSKSLLKLSTQQQEEVKSCKLHPTDEHTEKGSEYYTFVQKVRSVEDVQKGLYKARLKFPDATHVSCGYRLQRPTGPYDQQGHDDLEYGAGRNILAVLKDKKVLNIAVYIVRYYGGENLGPRRFKIVKMLTESAISTYQFKLRQRNSRRFRAGSMDSQSSVTSAMSALSAMSYEEAELEGAANVSGEDDEQEPEENPTDEEPGIRQAENKDET